MSTSDSDDDKPLLELIKKRKAQVAKDIESGRVKEEPGLKTKKAKVDSEPRVKKEEAKDQSKSKASKGSTTSDFYQTDKGKLVQRLLCRWWYAITWPLPEDIPAPPDGFEVLDGFPGVFISTAVSYCFRIMSS
jgi:hypothetical protein